MCSLDHAVVQPSSQTQPPACLGEPAGCRAATILLLLHAENQQLGRSRPAPQLWECQPSAPAALPRTGCRGRLLPARCRCHPEPLTAAQRSALAPCRSCGPGMLRGCCSEPELQRSAAARPSFSAELRKRTAQRMPKHSKATRAGGWSCSNEQPAHGHWVIDKFWTPQHTLPVALYHGNKAAGIPARTQGCYTLLSPQLSPAKEWFLEVDFLPVFILVESVATQSVLVCTGEHVKSCELVTAPGFTGSGLHLPMFMLSEECLTALTWF